MLLPIFSQMRLESCRIEYFTVQTGEEQVNELSHSGRAIV